MDIVYLTIDRGNTRTKAALWTPQGNMCAYGCFEGEVSPYAIIDSLRGANRYHVARAALCTVVRVGSSYLRHLGDLAPAVVVGAGHCEPLKISYATPQTLGPDRVAAAAGALAIAGKGPLLVADIGTAATFDYVDADGTFTGGNISAGMAMRLHALHDHTAALPLVHECDGTAPLMGNDTRSALAIGALRGLAAELDYYKAHTGARTIVTGGAGAAVISATANPSDYTYDPYLVLRGIFSILKHND